MYARQVAVLEYIEGICTSSAAANLIINSRLAATLVSLLRSGSLSTIR